MKKAALFVLIVSMATPGLFGQTVNPGPSNNEQTSAAERDSIKEVKLQSTMTYPLIKSSKAAGVLPVADIEEKQDPSLDYKLIFAISSVDKDKMQKTNDALIEVARSLNLHVAAGISKGHIQAVVVVFKQGLNILLKDEEYLQKFNSPNPNTALIKELQSAGVKFISCGQSMARTGIQKENMLPDVKVSLAARVTFSEYETMHYVLQ